MIDNPVFVPLASRPFWAFHSGRKSVELRAAKGRWSPRHVRAGRAVLLRRGYSTPDQMRGVVGRVALVSSFADLPAWALEGADVDRPEAVRYFDPEAPILAFEVLGAAPASVVVAASSGGGA